jgi:parvulin-like peptidyl-prolyl isomerase
MSKKNADREKEEEKDLDEEEDDEAEDEEDEDEHPATSAKAVDVRKARARTRPAPSHDHDDDHDDDDEDQVDAEDPYWWTPHAVLSALVLVGVLGFFGVFNKVLAPIAAHPATSTATAEKTATTTPSHDKPAGDTANKPPEQRQEFGAKHLLVQYKGSARAAPTITRTEEEAKARATEAMKKARSGTKFEDVVKEYSDEPGAAQRGGDLGKFRKGQMVPAFQDAVEKLKVGEISDLVKTQFGYHVIQRTQ